MNFREMGVPEACYFGCPSTNFRELEKEFNAAEAAVTEARESGDRAAIAEATRNYGAPLNRAGSVIENIPDQADGPWGVTFLEDTPHDVRSKVQAQRCCRYAGIVIIAPGKDMKDITIDRPY